ncbi:hypothetical protein JNK13_02250 [bacterium]|nr:hypothetical protein [bacterium]
MSDLRRFHSLDPREQLVLALGILLDGNQVTEFIAADLERGAPLVKAAQEVLALPTDLQLQFLGTIIRRQISGKIS